MCQPSRMLKCTKRALLGAVLEHHPVSSHGLDDGSPLGNRKSDRFLEIHVLSRTDGSKRVKPMPVIRSGDGNRVDVIPSQQLAEITILGAVMIALYLVRHGLCRCRSLAVDVAYGNQPRIAQRTPHSNVLHPLPSRPDHGKIQAT